MTIWALVLTVMGSVYVPSDVSGKGDAEFRYRHECMALASDWERYGFQGQCIERESARPLLREKK